MLVVAHTRDHDVSWMDRGLPDLDKTLYVVDDRNATNQIPRNKGREAMVYLTYIIDHYDSLPDTVLFFHPDQFTWHNNVLLNLDTALTIRRMNDARVARNGYMNSRCHLDPGCPDWLRVAGDKRPPDPLKKMEETSFTVDVWREIHPADVPPFAVSQPCCAQFAVSRDRIRARPLSDYIHYRNWLLNTTLADLVSGRIMEYSWQYIFTGESEFCPSQDDCYCDGYGICFGGDDKLQEWLDTLRRMELVGDQLKDLADQELGDSPESLELQQKREALNGLVQKLKQDAYDRGDRMRDRDSRGWFRR
ncbi:MAG: hypothetical protein Q9227_006601 [Pyrenula ochraceoflavens]